MAHISERFRIGRKTPERLQMGRVVVITGASSGIGRCAAALFGREGWQVGLIARGRAGLESIYADLVGAGISSAAAAADVADGRALEAAAAFIEAELGPMDVWVNCAGNGVYGPFLSVPEEEFRRVTDVTYRAPSTGRASRCAG
jgi:NAD(P)-dependent dehydrogenase (short-subunit alcohol dehydrogenase family)